MRLIDADALLEKMKKTDRYFDIVFDIEDAPTVDVIEVIKNTFANCEMKLTPYTEPIQHGKWTHERLASTTGGSYPVVRCSLCQNTIPFEWETRYCPHCGAKMDGMI